MQAYLSLSSAFISSASKFELLKLASGLVERLSAIGTIVQPSRISPESCSIASNFKREFSQSLKALLHQDLSLSDLSQLPSLKLENGGHECVYPSPGWMCPNVGNLSPSNTSLRYALHFRTCCHLS